jgi:DmsE family decaheme c-type cytochrome
VFNWLGPFLAKIQWLTLVGLLCFCNSQIWAADKAAPRSDLALRNDAKCTHCHDETDGNTLTIGQTRHGVRADSRTPTCTDCHGESKEHTDFRGMSTPPLTDRPMASKTVLSSEQKNVPCLSCHQGGKQIFWSSSAHATRDVACVSCHNIHTPKDKVLDKRKQPAVCFTCHKQQRVETQKPSHHPITEGKMTCSDCHNVHGSSGEKLLLKDTVNATCFTCHAEKRGPFLHNHQPVSEDCGNCHNPHGTSADNLLKARMPFLCQQCHGATSHYGNIPGVREFMPNATSTNIGPGLAQARGCTNCHTNIHGSNSPSNATSSRANGFFR